MRRLAKVWVVVAAALVAAAALATTLVVMASGSQDSPPPGDPADLNVDPEERPESPSQTQPDAIAGTSPPGPLPARGSSGTTSLPRAPAPAGDPDRPVSSDDPPPSPRPAPPPPADGIDSFEDCVRAGYPVAESYPEQCFTPDGRSFTRQIG